MLKFLLDVHILSTNEKLTVTFVHITCFGQRITVTLPGHVAQSVMCLATDASLTADPGVASSIPARSYTFVEIDHEIISKVILLPSSLCRMGQKNGSV